MRTGSGAPQLVLLVPKVVGASIFDRKVLVEEEGELGGGLERRSVVGGCAAVVLPLLIVSPAKTH